MAIIIGSARIDENGKASGGAAGDQKQNSSTNDTAGEVSLQNFYVHSNGWVILRPKSVDHANAIAKNMITACNNSNIGYDQSNRLGVVSNGVNSKVKTEADCSSLVRECIKEATGKDPGNFTTANEVTAIIATGLFTNEGNYKSQSTTPIYNGDVLVTKTKGHTVIVTSGSPRSSSSSDSGSSSNSSANCFAKYTGTSASIVTALKAVGCSDTSLTYRKIIASANGITGYTGTATQNTNMLKLLKAGNLKKPAGTTQSSCFAKYTGTSASIVTALKAVGCSDTSLTYRKKIAAANGISNYAGTAAQNTNMLKMLKAGTLKKP